MAQKTIKQVQTPALLGKTKSSLLDDRKFAITDTNSAILTSSGDKADIAAT